MVVPGFDLGINPAIAVGGRNSSYRDQRVKPGDDTLEKPMNWISEVVRPKIKTLFKRETPENLWIKCPETGQVVFHKDVEANQFVIPSSNYHMRISAPQRLKARV